GQYAPGSTFKVVSTLALLRSGMTAQSAVECTPSAVVSGYTFENYPAYPAEHETTIPLRLAIAHSCNTALINARDQVPAEDVAAAAGALGVGQSNPEGWPGFLGAVPEDATGTEHAASLIGQGQVLASPLAVATMAASVADGAAVSPVLVVGPPEVADDPASAPAQPLTTEEAEQLREMMRAVVQEGTGTQLADVPGPPVSAKTGTAESGSGDGARLDSWMVAFQGDLVVAVVVEAGGEGTQAAGPVVEDFLRAVG
ncbi:penicillin-binding transpeptidase domain-containing protein, partial [Georgenia sp. 10Sc9-8]|nr:penicillin-binding transpeptidase domain-containing protein [Georgenia halotolerans]